MAVKPIKDYAGYIVIEVYADTPEEAAREAVRSIREASAILVDVIPLDGLSTREPVPSEHPNATQHEVE